MRRGRPHSSAARGELRGRRAGAYRLLREIGRGGNGTVYLATRDDDEFRKDVAIKLVYPGIDSSEIVERFRRERQILASLDHPHIAKLHDGGTTDDRLPYFVMEYVEGEPMDRYCDSRSLSGKPGSPFFATCARRCTSHTRTSSCTATSSPRTSS